MEDKKEVPNIYDESTDDSSSLGSSPYQSDEEIIKSLFAHGNESTSSSDDQETVHADFPSMAIDIEESRLILEQTALKRTTDPGHRIFPQSAKKHLELSLQNPGDKVDVISREIQNVLRQHVGWAYVAHQMAHTDKFQCRKQPNMSICDVAIIRATQPLHILTFVEDGGKQEHAVEYNAQLTRSIMGFIKKETGVSLDVVYGVVPASTWKDEKLFKEKLERLETVARRKALPGYLHMDTERYTVITKALVDLYSEPGMKLHTMQEVQRLRKKFLKHMYDKEGKPIRAKIFIFGPRGAGEFSFCNGLISALKDSDTPSDYFADRNLYRSLTSRFQPTQIGDHSMVDMPGILGSGDFKMETIEAMACSTVGHETQITKPLDVKGGLSQQEEWKDVLCAVLVLHHGITVGEELKRQIDAIIRYDGYGALSYHLVLTHLDECDPQFKNPDNIPNLYSSPLVQEAVKNMSEQTGIPPYSISYVKNYVTETETYINTQLLHLRALDRILTSAADQEGTVI